MSGGISRSGWLAGALAAGLLVTGCQGSGRPPRLETVESLVGRGFGQSTVVMLNDVHDGALRNKRSRAQMIRALDAAHRSGVRFVALEALEGEVAAAANSSRTVPTEGGPYLDQEDMRAVLQHALDTGFTLVKYEPDFEKEAPAELQALARSDLRVTNWRDRAQAQALARFLKAQPAKTKLLVFPGLGHLYEVSAGGWTPMAVQFKKLTGVDPFTIDQSVTADIGPRQPAADVADLADQLRAIGGTGGLLARDDPNSARRSRKNVDAYLLSIDNSME